MNYESIDCGGGMFVRVGENTAVYYGCQPYDPMQPAKDVWPLPWIRDPPPNTRPWIGDPAPPAYPPTPIVPPPTVGTLDAYDIMRELDKLDDSGRRLVFDWLKQRCEK